MGSEIYGGPGEDDLTGSTDATDDIYGGSNDSVIDALDGSEDGSEDFVDCGLLKSPTAGGFEIDTEECENAIVSTPSLKRP